MTWACIDDGVWRGSFSESYDHDVEDTLRHHIRVTHGGPFALAWAVPRTPHAHQGSVLQVTGSCSRVQVCVLTMVSPCDVETVMV